MQRWPVGLIEGTAGIERLRANVSSRFESDERGGRDVDGELHDKQVLASEAPGERVLPLSLPRDTMTMVAESWGTTGGGLAKPQLSTLSASLAARSRDAVRGDCAVDGLAGSSGSSSCMPFHQKTQKLGRDERNDNLGSSRGCMQKMKTVRACR